MKMSVYRTPPLSVNSFSQTANTVGSSKESKASSGEQEGGPEEDNKQCE